MSLALLESSSTAPTLSALLPPKTDRAAFIGQTGSGKTTLARLLLDRKPYVVVHDGKNGLNLREWDGYTVRTKLRDVVRLNPRAHPRILYRPNEHEVQDLGVQNSFFRWIFRRRNCTVYVDETFMLQVGGVWPRYHFLCITQGRAPESEGGRGIEVWSGMQRPSWIPLVTLSEAEHFYVFRLQHADDRKRMRGVTGLSDALITPDALPKQVFWYVQTGEVPQGPYKLDLGR